MSRLDVLVHLDCLSAPHVISLFSFSRVYIFLVFLCDTSSTAQGGGGSLDVGFVNHGWQSESTDCY